MSSAITSPKISIIISTYNGAKYIAATIDSILKQTHQNWELIIIDDGSDDKTTEVITGFKDGRIQLHVAGRIGINGRVKNIGLSKASGELIAFIDHDDLWAPEKLEKQAAVLQQYPAAGFSLTGGCNFREPGKPVEYFYKQRDGIIYDNIFIACFRSEVAGFTQTLLVRRECIPVSGTFKETASFSDVDFIINLAWHFKAVIIYEPLVYRRIHEGNCNQANWENSNYEGIEIIETYK
ncbi:MAG: glycosyltransferase family 2 protein, partial [Chitinophagaceae bacterium]